MKHFLSILLLCLTLSISFASQAEKIKVMLDFRHFYSPNDGNYVETMMHFGGYSMTYKKNETGRLQGKLFVTQVFRIGDSVISFKKYEILTPEVMDSVYSDFYDIQRFKLPAGDYTYDIQIEDAFAKKKKEKAIYHNQPIEVLDYGKEISISRPEYIESVSRSKEDNMFSKSGVDIIPYIADYFPAELTNLAFYSEIYFPNDTNDYVVKHSVKSFESKTIVLDLFKQKRIKGATVVPFINNFDISSLPSGNYYLSTEIVNRKNETVTSKLEYFQRSNPFLSIDPEELENLEISRNFKRLDSIMYFLEALIPITGKAEQKTILSILKSKDTIIAKKYFFQFWKKTEPVDSWFGFTKYRREVYKTENLFGTNIRRGFQSDRGRVYLQHGSPNQRVERPQEPNSYPYEIWNYYQVGNQSNRSFVFYNPSLVNGYYELLHSDMIGELQNKDWQMILRDRNTSPSQRQNGNVKDTFGGNAGDWFKN